MAWSFHFMRFFYVNGPKVSRNDVRCKTSSRYLAPSLKKSPNMPIWDLSPYFVIRGKVTSPFSALPAQRSWPANETLSYDRASATCVCCTHTVVRKCCTSLLYYLDNRRRTAGERYFARDCLPAAHCRGTATAAVEPAGLYRQLAAGYIGSGLHRRLPLQPVVAKDTYEYEYRYKNMLPSSDEIFKCKKHTILVDNHDYIWIVMVQWYTRRLYSTTCIQHWLIT